MKEIIVYLDEAQVKQFVLFQKHFDTFALMLDKGVFDQKGATVTLNFDKFGTLKTIGRADFLHIHGVDFDNTNR